MTFADGSTVAGEICKGDADTGLAVATVKKKALNDSTREGIVVSDLTDTKQRTERYSNRNRKSCR